MGVPEHVMEQHRQMIDRQWTELRESLFSLEFITFPIYERPFENEQCLLVTLDCHHMSLKVSP
jgi:hypothetical protein